ncbi:cation transporter [Parasediminibacterium sp. JCM 36343]|uniref:cation transporter n=1 Tax=Parasediminibacterium sp. JCM 36343 TaxID=3374279 RepID=UPI00397B11BC
METVTNNAIASTGIETTVNKTYPVTGMSCAACAKGVQNILQKQEGVQSALVNFPDKKVDIVFNSDIVSPAKLKKAVKSIGYDLLVD